MAPTISSRVSDNTEPPQAMPDTAMHQNDAEDATVRRLFDNNPNFREDMEWTMLVKFAANDTGEDVNIVQIHLTVMHLMQ